MRGHEVEVGSGKILARMVSAKDGTDLAQIAIKAHWDLTEEGFPYLSVEILTDDLDREVRRMIQVAVDDQPVWTVDGKRLDTGEEL